MPKSPTKPAPKSHKEAGIGAATLGGDTVKVDAVCVTTTGHGELNLGNGAAQLSSVEDGVVRWIVTRNNDLGIALIVTRR